MVKLVNVNYQDFLTKYYLVYLPWFHRPKRSYKHVASMKICHQFCGIWFWKIKKKAMKSPGKVLDFS